MKLVEELKNLETLNVKNWRIFFSKEGEENKKVGIYTASASGLIYTQDNMGNQSTLEKRALKHVISQNILD